MTHWARSPFIEVPDPAAPKASGSKEPEDIFADKERAAWGTGQAPEPRCDFSPGRVSMPVISGGARALCLWRRSIYGMTLSQIKADPDMPEFFASRLAVLILQIIGPHPDPRDFVIVSPPKRRHPGKANFASRMCAIIAASLGLGYIDDFILCRTRARVDPEFTLGAPLPEQRNILVVDDIVTTGSTLAASRALISDAGANPILFAGIRNAK